MDCRDEVGEERTLNRSLNVPGLTSLKSSETGAEQINTLSIDRNKDFMTYFADFGPAVEAQAANGTCEDIPIGTK